MTVMSTNTDELPPLVGAIEIAMMAVVALAVGGALLVVGHPVIGLTCLAVGALVLVALVVGLVVGVGQASSLHQLDARK